MTRRALILGVGGMDGSYLAELLLSKGYAVHGMVRRSSVDNLWRVRHVLDRLTLHQGDLIDQCSVHRIIDEVRPHELYNLADQDHVGFSRSAPAYSMDVTAAAVVRLLESVRLIDKQIRVLQPASATMFGDAAPPQHEGTPLNPLSPYAVAKAAAYHAARYYRQAHGMFVATAVFFNHDSPRRGEDYLLQKICRGAVRVARRRQDNITLGDLDARVDVGFAPEYVEAAWRALQPDAPDDFVVATGKGYTVGELAELALREAGVSPQGRVVDDPHFAPPGRAHGLIGDAGKAARRLGFAPKYDAAEVVKVLVNHHRLAEGWA